MSEDSNGKRVEFYGGIASVLIPMVVFLCLSIYLFMFKHAFDMTGLAMGAFLGLAIGALFCKNWNNYWDGVVHGVSSNLTGTVVTILMAAGIFSAMMRNGGVAEGLVWLGTKAAITGRVFCAFTFVASAVIATATGTSIGTIFASVPVFFSAGVTLGADPSMLAGAILSGAIFGDNLAPVSDVTIISVSTQRYRKKEGIAEIGGVVASRAKYSIAAGLLTIPFYLLGGGSNAVYATDAMMDSGGLVMLIPVAILIYVAIKTENVFSATASGVISGIAVGLLAGRFAIQDIFSVTDGNIGGFLYSGINSMAGTILLCMSLFGVIGVLERSGALEMLTERLRGTNIGSTPRGAELTMGLGSLICSFAFASVTSAALIMFGPIGDQIGGAAGIHPYRRSNIMSSLANSIPVVMPFSAFVFIVMAAVSSQQSGEAVTPFTLFYGTVYPWALFVVFSFCIVTGLGRQFEGEDGKPIKEAD
ncbi:MAG: hypothetical protein LBK91_03105, partial [Synergistaceae bacterium]|nr:hypothetical protein [Synergistaceae bacterium]